MHRASSYSLRGGGTGLLIFSLLFFAGATARAQWATQTVALPWNFTYDITLGQLYQQLTLVIHGADR